jgi:hypothetical protein
MTRAVMNDDKGRGSQEAAAAVDGRVHDRPGLQQIAKRPGGEKMS